MKKILKSIIRSQVGRIIITEIVELLIQKLLTKVEELPTESQPIVTNFLNQISEDVLNEVIDTV